MNDKEIERFMRGVYDNAYKKLEDTKSHANVNKDEILKLIGYALILFDMKKNYKKAERFIAVPVVDMLNEERDEFIEALETGLYETLDEMCDFYGYKISDNKKKEIVDKAFKGLTYKERNKNNSTFFKNRLIKLISEICRGKVETNQVKDKVEKEFKTHLFKEMRLYISEVTRVASLAFLIENYNKKVQYNSVLERNTCADCRDLDGQIFYAREALDILPMHSNCKCYWTSVNIDEGI